MLSANINGSLSIAFCIHVNFCYSPDSLKEQKISVFTEDGQTIDAVISVT
jgi:hypothetical protein